MAERRDESLARLADLVLSIARKIDANGISHPDAIRLSSLESLVMRHIHRNPGISPSALASALTLRSSNASAALRSLEQKGFITKAAHPDDRRSVELHATAAASRNLDLIRAEWAAMLAPLLEGEEDLEPAIRTLGRLDAGMNGKG